MTDDLPDDVKHAIALRKMGQDLQAGKILFERVPNASRPAWAANLLQLVLDRIDANIPIVEQLFLVTDNPHYWHTAHDAFDQIRDGVLFYDNPKNQILDRIGHTQMSDILGFAELVAKVTYNATNPYDEFDEDSGWYIPIYVWRYTDRLNDDEFEQAAWEMLITFP